MNYVLLGILVFQIIIIVVVLRVASAGLDVMLILLAIVFAGNLANVYLFTFMMWKPLEKRWPVQPLQDDAVSRGFQTFWFGPIARFNLCLHATADTKYIHVAPMAPMRWMNAKPISLPLDELHSLKPTLFPGLMQAKIRDRTFVGPAWCISLAQPAHDSQ